MVFKTILLILALLTCFSSSLKTNLKNKSMLKVKDNEFKNVIENGNFESKNLRGGYEQTNTLNGWNVIKTIEVGASNLYGKWNSLNGQVAELDPQGLNSIISQDFSVEKPTTCQVKIDYLSRTGGTEGDGFVLYLNENEVFRIIGEDYDQHHLEKTVNCIGGKNTLRIEGISKVSLNSYAMTIDNVQVLVPVNIVDAPVDC